MIGKDSADSVRGKYINVRGENYIRRKKHILLIEHGVMVAEIFKKWLSMMLKQRVFKRVFASMNHETNDSNKQTQSMPSKCLQEALS